MDRDMDRWDRWKYIDMDICIRKMDRDMDRWRYRY